MSKSSESKPVVIHFKRFRRFLSRPTPEIPKKHAFHLGSKMNGPPAVRTEVDPDSIRNAWVSAFGGRLRIDDQRGFFLDGLPISLDALMLETNRIRKTAGIEPVGRNPRWFV